MTLQEMDLCSPSEGKTRGNILENLPYQPGAGKIRQNMPNLRVFNKFRVQSGRRNPPLLFGRCGFSKKRLFLVFLGIKTCFMSIRAYRQVLWCAALFCSTTPEQTQIPQNRANSRVFDGLRESSGGRKRPITILGPGNPKKRGISGENPLYEGTLVCSTIVQDQPGAGNNTPK